MLILWLRAQAKAHQEKDRRQKTEDRRQKTEDRRQKTEDRRQKTEDSLLRPKKAARENCQFRPPLRHHISRSAISKRLGVAGRRQVGESP
ncbi:DUF874 family protein [Plesiomonas shigelloides]|uniref:DUF874 family protein n=1 Tax=Plesiomonas shigelloides TaxID=703 RepID=UPI001C03C2D6|nr:DUF874 family protein [Plesiomonas shigelloides]